MFLSEKLQHCPAASKQTFVLQHIFNRSHAALQMLCEASIYAQDVNRSIWDFSLEFSLLREGGLAQSDLRWLVCKGFLEHAREIDFEDSESRGFHPTKSLFFRRNSCFVLTEAGQSLVRQPLRQHIGSNPESNDPSSTLNHQDSKQLPLKPHWDSTRQELTVGCQIVKQFKIPAPNQEIILAAFQEANWVELIDDPLPQRRADPKRLLQDTIASLNRNQKCELLRFLADDRGVRWEFVPPPNVS